MTSFSITFDYRCPFARNAHEHVLSGLAAGADWQVRFVPFSLDQVHVEEGEPPVWERPAQAGSLLALQVGTMVRDAHPDAFPVVHRALFAARHDRGLDLRDPGVLAGVIDDAGLDGGELLAAAGEGAGLDVVRAEHEAAARDHTVWGVPTFIVADQAVFVRLMDRPGDDPALARETIDRVLDLLEGAPGLNEFKHTSLPR